VFTAGIGENAPVIRARICESASWLGLRVDSSRNARGDGIISADDSAIESLVIPTDEELAIARELRTWRAIPRS
jgi:acetate kinase